MAGPFRLPVALTLLAGVALGASAPAPPITFWNEQRRGSNLFNAVETPERLQAAKAFGNTWVRLAPNKWLNGRSAALEGDFLLGRPETFRGIDPADLRLLRLRLDDAEQAGLKVVLTMLSLPGSRWSQHNHDVEDRRIWSDATQQESAIAFWKELAAALRGHPALVGYNLRNEPSPELVKPRFHDWYTGDYEAWAKQVATTPADLNQFYRRTVKAIRSVDPDTPIVLDSGFFATPWGFKVLAPVDDDRTLYSFHMYEPGTFTGRLNRGRYRYPGPAPIGEADDAPTVHWDHAQLDTFLRPVADWQTRHGIPSSRIVVGEFGVYRRNAGAREYLRDLVRIFNRHRWHWAFYSFREDTWDGMDYELGDSQAKAPYFQAIERGRSPGPDVYRPNPLAALLQAAVRGEPLP
jgi:hypothetical protein